MPVHDFQCSTCNTLDLDLYWSSWRDVPHETPCPSCGEPMTKMAGKVTVWADVSVFNHNTGYLEPGPNRGPMPQEEFWQGTQYVDMDMVNPYLGKDHPGHFSNDTGHRVYGDLARR